MPAFLQGLFAAASFLSRLAPARVLPDGALSRSVPWYPLVGCVLGVFATAAAMIWPLFSPLFITTWIWPAAWTYTLLLAWLTRGLHWDGFADIADALGSGKHGEGFRHVLKDSRIGAFGALALAFGLVGQIVLAASCLEQGDIGALVWAPLFGRMLIVILARGAKPHPSAVLGALVRPGAGGFGAAAAVLLSLCAGFFLAGPPTFLLGAVFAVPGMGILFSLAKREGGLSGDFFGAAVIWGELSALCAGALLHL